jgi:hypothetical protein
VAAIHPRPAKTEVAAQSRKRYGGFASILENSCHSGSDAIAGIGGFLHKSEMGLYTIVCDYAGGTFVSQVQATDEHDALTQLATVLPSERTLGDASERVAKAALAGDSELVPIEGLTGVWCWTATVDDALALINIIRSAE